MEENIKYVLPCHIKINAVALSDLYTHMHMYKHNIFFFNL